MPGWDDDQYQMEGEGSGGGGTVVGFPVDAFFQDGTYGPELVMVLRRSHPELTPQAKVEVRWSWGVAGQKERPNWSVVGDGKAIVHAEGKAINAGTALGKLFKHTKETFPAPPEGFDPKSAESWKSLETLGDAEWAWIEERKRVLDEATGKWGPDPDETRVNRYLVPVGYTGAETNGQVFDLTGIPAELVTQMRDAVANVPAGDKNALFAALGTVPGAFNVQTVTGALAGDTTAEALRVALVDF